MAKTISEGSTPQRVLVGVLSGAILLLVGGAGGTVFAERGIQKVADAVSLHAGLSGHPVDEVRITRIERDIISMQAAIRQNAGTSSSILEMQQRLMVKFDRMVDERK